ncbi:MAG: riboflavin synthase [Nitrospirae bacterium]|nr:riboflavin synthase [Nitrospirota bacterium]
MFTGIITGMGKVVSFAKKGKTAVITLKSDMSDVSVGNSISINGTCLTVTSIEKGIMSFDLSEETLKSTNMSELKAGDSVNLEPSLSANGKLGGHFVTGHVDGIGRIRAKVKEADTMKIEITVAEHVMLHLVKKGSVAVDGISLTVVDVFKDSFTVVIIPHTALVTTIGTKGIGSSVNIETDIIGKYVLRFMQRETEEGTLMSRLEEAGFVGGKR